MVIHIPNTWISLPPELVIRKPFESLMMDYKPRPLYKRSVYMRNMFIIGVFQFKKGWYQNHVANFQKWMSPQWNYFMLDDVTRNLSHVLSYYVWGLVRSLSNSQIYTLPLHGSAVLYSIYWSNQSTSHAHILFMNDSVGLVCKIHTNQAVISPTGRYSNFHNNSKWPCWLAKK